MTRHQKLLLAIGGTVLVLIIAASLWAVMRRKAAAPAVNAPVASAPNTNTPQAAQPVSPAAAPALPPTATAEELARAQLVASAKQFAERYGSYSTDGDYQNLTDLFPLMTQSMQRTAQATITAGKNQAVPDVFTGVTTVAVSASVSSLDLASGRAMVAVKSQRQNTIGTQKNNSYETLTLSFVRSGSVWKVDAASWGK